MKPISARVTNFRSVEDSGDFDVHPITCLVGKNEAGKSAILMALAALNPHISTPAVLDRERDYPRRHLTNYAARHKGKEAVAITTEWELDDDDVAAIEKDLCPGILSSRNVEVSRSYGATKPTIQAHINFQTGLDWLYTKFDLDDSERDAIKSATTTDAVSQALKALSEKSPNLAKLEAYITQTGSFTTRINSIIEGALPQVMYFSAYDTMAGAIQIEQIQQLKANGQLQHDDYRAERLFAEFMQYAGISIADITSVNTFETFNAKLQAASNHITDQILEYWTQNPDLTVQVAISAAKAGDKAPLNTGTIARARIYNQLHRVDTPFSERSAGFVWFFSFLVKFAQVKNESRPVVLLLDEPGLTLHGKAQADLLRFFKEKLAPHHQIIYTTHSPFMVPADDLSSVLIVEDQVDVQRERRVPIGTKVRSDVLSRDPDTLFPLQGALGYEVSQSLFVGANTLLVEGPGDILYLQALSDALRRRRRTGLDPRWTLCPAGGIDKIRPFVSLFAGNHLNVAVLSDQAAGDKRKIEDLKRAAILKAGHFYTVADFLGRVEADIEDLLEPGLFAAIVNDAYKLEAAHQLNSAKLATADLTTERAVKRAESAFKVMPGTVPEFDHFTPAAWLIRNPQILDAATPEVDATLERAAKVFTTFNALLG